MGSPSAWTVPLLAAFATAVLCCSSEAAGSVHQASGIRLPANIEGRLLRQELKESAKSYSVVYTTKAGHEVLVHVYPSKHGAHGPSRLDGDEKSGASPAFTEELDRLISHQSEGLKDATVVSRRRFQALAKNGPVGIKPTVRGKLEGKIESREFLLFERNDCFVSITTRYLAEDWLKTGQTFTDAPISWAGRRPNDDSSSRAHNSKTPIAQDEHSPKTPV